MVLSSEIIKTDADVPVADSLTCVLVLAATNSSVFTTIIEPFSQRIAQKVALPSGTVKGCTVGAAPAPTATATPVTTTAGRRLMQVGSYPSSLQTHVCGHAWRHYRSRWIWISLKPVLFLQYQR